MEIIDWTARFVKQKYGDIATIQKIKLSIVHIFLIVDNYTPQQHVY